MKPNREAFLNWVKDKNFPPSEIDVVSAKKNNLKFDNHEQNANEKNILSEKSLKIAFGLLQRAIG